MELELRYNAVKVTDLAKAQAVCDRFDFLGTRFFPDEQRVLQHVDQNPDDLWPRALPVTDAPNENDFDAFYEDGAQGFVSFLGEMAPLLEEPLFILAVSHDGGAKGAAWYVHPSGKVEVREAGANAF